jgi:hypothetical protein
LQPTPPNYGVAAELNTLDESGLSDSKSDFAVRDRVDNPGIWNLSLRGQSLGTP